MPASQAKDLPQFRRESIEAMSPIGKEIAKMLQKAGQIQIIDENDGGAD